jgi:hypothetical protein
MPNAPSTKPRSVQQAMVSSTFTDLKEHRQALIKALNEHDLHPNAMEHDSAKPSQESISPCEASPETLSCVDEQISDF